MTERENGRHKEPHISIGETARKTLRLAHNFPLFRRKAENAVLALGVKNSPEALAIQEHFGPSYRFGPQYSEMGYCTKAFADILHPNQDNTDIGIIATEFYVFLDRLDDTIDNPNCRREEKLSVLLTARDMLRGEEIADQNPNIQAMVLLTQDMRTRTAALSDTPDCVDKFAVKCEGTLDALFKETFPKSERRHLATTVNVGRKCAAPLMELITCKYGEPFPSPTAGNLVAIGNILDDYWDVIKDQNAQKSTFLTIALINKRMRSPEVIIRTLLELQMHKLAFFYGTKLLKKAMDPLSKERQEDVLAIAMFAQIGVFQRRYNSLTGKFRVLS